MYAEGTYFLSEGVAVDPPVHSPHPLTHTHTCSSMVTLYAVYFAIYFISKRGVFFKNIEIAEKFFLWHKMKAINPSFVGSKLKAFSCESFKQSVSKI